MKLTHLLLPLVLLSLSACATKSMTTTGAIRAPSGISTVQIEFDPIVSSQIEIRKSAQGLAPTINEFDKALAIRDAAALNRVFARGFKERFPGEALKHGLKVQAAGTQLPKLKISVTSFSMNCANGSCISTLRLSGDLLDAAGVPIWNFFSTVGQPIPSSKITDDIFESFEASLFNTMNADGVIAKK
jgi:hypothetical protein